MTTAISTKSITTTCTMEPYPSRTACSRALAPLPSPMITRTCRNCITVMTIRSQEEQDVSSPVSWRAASHALRLFAEESRSIYCSQASESLMSASLLPRRPPPEEKDIFIDHYPVWFSIRYRGQSFCFPHTGAAGGCYEPLSCIHHVSECVLALSGSSLIHKPAESFAKTCSAALSAKVETF